MSTQNIDLGNATSASITFNTKDKYNTEDMVFNITRSDWEQNTKDKNGYVPAPTSAHPNSIWRTNRLGVPSWQTAVEASKWCDTPIIKHRDIMGTISNNDYVVPITDIDSAAGGADAWNELYIIVLFGGKDMEGKNVDMQAFQFTKDILTTNFTGGDILPTTKHFNACYPLTIDVMNEAHCDLRLFADSTTIELKMCKIWVHDFNTNLNNTNLPASYSAQLDYLTGMHVGAFRHAAGHYVYPIVSANRVFTYNVDAKTVIEETVNSNNYNRCLNGMYFIKSKADAEYASGNQVQGTNFVPLGSNCSTRDVRNHHDLATMFVFWR